MYRPAARRAYSTPLGDLLAFLDGLSMPRLGLIVLLCAGALFFLLTQRSEAPRRIVAHGVPGSIYRINGGQPAPAPKTGGTPPGRIEIAVPEFANLLVTPRHITSEFGHYPDGSPHYGIDLDAWYGDIQYAPVGGLVTEVLRGCVEGDDTCGKGWGNHVWFKSDEDGKYVLLAHYQKIYDDIQTGVRFSAGHPIGETGSTGYSSGPHVHLQVNPTGMQNPGSENPAWTFPWLRCGEPTLGTYFGSACK